ncbi:hypothetical protein Q0Z83_014280 [Actinoplanes sichuanensis]|uniref:Prenyltransferase n=1 Tax=Actinoplanes sichuanensis TaxID=512349 RepID=A0ABW4A5R6_9ACTN|nr:hypothetical protein [Actinoplanes sichuanensis]BEL03237.1 hypothetical protein Q0Z83_014280 [Actinoplanes sichuanensis]
MSFDLDAAARFVAMNGRALDWRRMSHLLGAATTEQVLTALDAYHNPDGGYGWALEPDLRSVTSQPVAAMHALEVLAEVGDTGSRSPRLFDWLAEHSLGDGGIPFALPFADIDGSAPHWTTADPDASSLQMTTQLAAQAHRLVRGRPDLAGHPWLTGATGYCLSVIDGLSGAPSAYELMFVMRFLDAVPEPGRLLERVAAMVRTDGPTPVGGTVGEVLHPLDFTPDAARASRALFSKEAIAADLDRLAAGQQPDGGWAVDFPAYSPAAAIEWRGYATVGSVRILRAETT